MPRSVDERFNFGRYIAELRKVFSSCVLGDDSIYMADGCVYPPRIGTSLPSGLVHTNNYHRAIARYNGRERIVPQFDPLYTNVSALRNARINYRGLLKDADPSKDY